MSETLNLSKTCLALGLTRQTVRRQLMDLTDILGEPLFELVDHQYIITPFGQEQLGGAKRVVSALDNWAGQNEFQTRVVNGLESSRYIDSSGRSFYSQQHSVSNISSHGAPLIKSAVSAWGQASAQIHHEALARIRPFSVLYRKTRAGWVFAEVGTESAYARWFGWEWAVSANGKLLAEDNVGSDYNEFISAAYSRIYDVGGLRLDHIYAHLPKDGLDPVPGSFQRLLMGGILPDGTPGLILIAVITKNVEIDGLDPNARNEVTPELAMDHLQ